MSDIQRFFRPIGSIELSAADREKAEACVRVAEAVARSTNSSVYVIDYATRDFLYVSPNPLFLCGRTADEVRRMGYAFYFEVVPDDEMKMLYEINEAGFSRFYSVPRERRLNLSIDYDFHIRVAERRLQLIHHKLTPIFLDQEGNIWLALCTVTVSPMKTVGNIIMTDNSTNERWTYSLAGRRWRAAEPIVLSEQEQTLLRLAVRGLSNGEIGEQMFISADTVKYHKKSLFQKLHAKNIAEAVAIAANLRLV